MRDSGLLMFSYGENGELLDDSTPKFFVNANGLILLTKKRIAI